MNIALSSTSTTKDEVDENLSLDNFDEILRKLSTASSKEVYFDEDNDLNFSNSNKNLFNNTEQTVYVVCKLISIS
jgi:hypothetical protein